MCSTSLRGVVTSLTPYSVISSLVTVSSVLLTVVSPMAGVY